MERKRFTWTSNAPANRLIEQRLRDQLNTVKLRPNGLLWVAYSGGVDSTVLLRCVVDVYPRDHIRAVHINHGLSHNAHQWGKHCTGFAAALGIRLEHRVVTIPPGNVEYEARQARMRVFEDLLHSNDVIATAHHTDDDLESLLWQFATGRALIGIPEWRRLGKGRLWRPLLGFSKSQLHEFACRRQLPYVSDESNEDLALSRNLLRHELIPALLRDFPELESVVRRFRRPTASTQSIGSLDLQPDLPSLERLRSWLLGFGLTPSENCLQSLSEQLQTRPFQRVRQSLGKGVSVGAYGNRLHFIEDVPPVRPRSVAVGEEQTLCNGQLTWELQDVGLPTNLPLQLRSLGVGERIQTQGKFRTCKELLRVAQIPPWERSTFPGLFQGDLLVALPGIALADSYGEIGGYFPIWTTKTVLNYSEQ